MEDGRTRPDGPVKVVVVARDATRLVQYEAALRVSGTTAVATADPDQGADLLLQYRPDVLVLDHGLPRLALFRLYGLAREDESGTPIQVVFVGQDDDTGPDDHYLPGDPSPSRVAVQVTSLIARVEEAAATAPAAGGPTQGAAVSTPPSAVDPARRAATDVPPARPAPAQTPPPVPPAASTNGQAADAAVEQPDAASPRKPGRRLDVMLVRIGLVLLILGGLLFLLQMQVNQAPLVTPTLAPLTPTRRPSPSPSPSPRADLSAPAALVLPAALASDL